MRHSFLFITINIFIALHYIHNSTRSYSLSYIGGFFLTEAAVSDEENRVTDKEINSFIKRRLNEAGRFAQKDNGLNDSKLKNKEGIKKKVRSKFEPSGKDVSKNKRAKQASMNSLQKGRNPLSEVKSSGLLPGGGRVSSVTKKRKKAKESAAAGAPSKLDESMTRGRKKTPLDIIKEERAAQVSILLVNYLSSFCFYNMDDR